MKSIVHTVKELKDEGKSMKSIREILKKKNNKPECIIPLSILEIGVMPDEQIEEYVNELKEKYTKIYEAHFTGDPTSFVRNNILEYTHFDARVLEYLDFNDPDTIYGVMTELKVDKDSIEGGGSCPTQYEVNTMDGRRLYFRLRWGGYTIEYLDNNSEISCDIIHSVSGFTAKSCRLFGTCTWEEAKDLLRDANLNIVEV